MGFEQRFLHFLTKAHFLSNDVGAGGYPGLGVDERKTDEVDFEAVAIFLLEGGEKFGRGLIAGRAEKVFEDRYEDAIGGRSFRGTSDKDVGPWKRKVLVHQIVCRATPGRQNEQKDQEKRARKRH